MDTNLTLMLPLEKNTILIKKKKLDKLLLFCFLMGSTLFFFLIALLISKTVKNGVDFFIFYDSAKLFWQGNNPYAHWNFFNPPWMHIIMLPFLAFKPEYAFGMWFEISFVVLILAAKRAGVFQQKLWWLSILMLILSPPVLLCLLWGNLDLILIFFCTINHPIALFFLALKPHIFWSVILLRLISWWISGKRKKAFLTAFSLTALYIVSFVIYGPYLFNGIGVIEKNFNASIWPFGFLPGLVLFFTTYLRKYRQVNPAMATAPLMSPQVSNNAWSSTLFSLCKQPLILTLLVLFYWLIPFVN